MQVANKNVKKCSTILQVQETKIKTILIFHLTPIRIAIFKKMGLG
jgi:hypothetical protein